MTFRILEPLFQFARAGLAFVVAQAVLLSASRASDINWNSSNGGMFAVLGNWQGNVVPGVSDTAVFNQPTTYTVNFNANATNSRMWVRNGSATFDFDGKTYQLTRSTSSVNATSDMSIVVGDLSGNIATLALKEGTLNGMQASIGNFSGAQGTIDLNGAAWNLSNLSVGLSGTGVLTIENGGSVSSGTNLIGNTSGSVGTVNVTGAGSTWSSTSSLRTGQSGSGLLTIENGGMVTSSDGYVAFAGSSQGTVYVRGAGSRWIDSGFLIVGNGGNGQLVVESGGTVSSTSGSIASSVGSQGAVTVTGAGSTWNISGALQVANKGSGSLVVQDGGTVNVSTLYTSISRLYGDGMISANGVILDGVDLLFDNTHGTQQALAFDTSGCLNLNVNGTGGLGAGNQDAGTLSIKEGATVHSSFGTMGYKITSHGLAIVSGAGSTWSNSGPLTVGYQGVGELTIESGGSLSNTSGIIGDESGSHGSVKVTGAGSIWTNSGSLNVGDAGVGELTIENGGQVSNTSSNIGLVQFSQGTVKVTGPGSKWLNSGSLNVGASGSTTGELVIENGAAVFNTIGTIGGSSGLGSVTVTGVGSAWTNSSTLSIKRTLSIENGGSVSCSAGTVDYYLSGGSSYQATVTVSGVDSKWTSTGSLTIGSGGNGQLIIENGGSTLSATGYVAYSGQGSVTISGAGSKWSNSGNLIVGAQSLTGSATGEGSITVRDGGILIVGGTLKLQQFGTFAGLGGSIGSVINNGTLAPGNSIGTMTIQGNYTQQSAGYLSLELAGTAAGSEYDQLVVTGSATLGGKLRLSLVNGFMPTIGSSFNLLDWGNISGTFSSLMLPTLAKGTWDSSQLYTTGVVSVTGPPGDFNNSGVVDAADYVVWRGDPNRTQNQYDLWRTHFGQTTGSGAAVGTSSGTAVPEPESTFLLLAIFAAFRIMRLPRVR